MLYYYWGGSTGVMLRKQIYPSNMMLLIKWEMSSLSAQTALFIFHCDGGSAPVHNHNVNVSINCIVIPSFALKSYISGIAHVILLFTRKQSNFHSLQASLTAFVVSITCARIRPLTSFNAPQALEGPRMNCD